MTITKIQSNLKRGNLFRCVKDHLDKYDRESKIKKDTLVLFREADEGKVQVEFIQDRHSTHYISYSEENFYNLFEYVPEGGQAIEKELQKMFGDASDIKEEIEEFNDQFTNVEKAFEVHQLPNSEYNKTNLLSGKTQEENPEPTTVALTIQEHFSKEEQIDGIATRIADNRNYMTDRLKDLRKVKAKMKQLILMKSKMLELALGVRDFTERMEKVITTLNLYLGTGEEIQQLVQGEWASPEEVLSVRQLVLYMDVESMIRMDSKGMDFRNIYEFDDWIMEKPEHLQQVLPEQKGIVCLKPRYENKHYSDNSLENVILNKENKKTYFLIRNGENLFRVAPSWNVGNKLFPSKKELDDIFIHIERDYGIGRKTEETEEIITPDHHKFDDAMEEFEDLSHHYRNTLTLIQGIIDRTGIFPDLQDRGVNFLNASQNENLIHYICDAEEGKLLGDGLPNFRDWQEEVNKKLTKGKRIVGDFGYEFKSNGRLTADDLPPENELFTLDRQKGDYLLFYYERGEQYVSTGWHDSEYRKPKKRASGKVKIDDTNIIAYDYATTELFDHFLNDRLSRMQYMDMIPIIKGIYKNKEKEEKEEAPFLQLIQAEVLKRAPSLSDSQSQRKARELVNWWKFKNKLHRSILADDKKAYRMILKELDRNSEFMSDKHKKILAEVTEELVDDTTLLLYRKNYTNFIKLSTNGEDEIFVHQEEFRYTKTKGLQFVKEERNILFTKYVSEMVTLYQDKKWEEWPKSNEQPKYIRRERFSELVEMLMDKVTGPQEHWNKSEGHEEYELDKYFPIRVGLRSDQREQYVVLQTVQYIKPKKVSQKEQEFEVKTFDFEIKTRKDEDFWLRTTHYHSRHYGEKRRDETMQEFLDKVVAEEENRDTVQNAKGKILTLDWYPENFGEILETYKVVEDYNQRLKDVKNLVNAGLNKLRDDIEEHYEEKANQKYLDAKGDPRNWDSYKSRNPVSKPQGWENIPKLGWYITQALIDGKLKLNDLLEKNFAGLHTMAECFYSEHGKDKWGYSRREIPTFSQKIYNLAKDTQLFTEEQVNEITERLIGIQL